MRSRVPLAAPGDLSPIEDLSDNKLHSPLSKLTLLMMR